VVSGIDWNDVIKKEARDSNEEYLGEVLKIIDEYVLIQKDFDQDILYIPQLHVESYDGNVLWFKLSKDHILNKYNRNNFEPSNKPHEGIVITEDNNIKPQIQKQVGELNALNNDPKHSIKITEDPITKTKKFDVSIITEKITLERRSPRGNIVAKPPISSKENIEINIKKEEVTLKKSIASSKEK
jgi:hypothetical protein